MKNKKAKQKWRGLLGAPFLADFHEVTLPYQLTARLDDLGQSS